MVGVETRINSQNPNPNLVVRTLPPCLFQAQCLPSEGCQRSADCPVRPTMLPSGSDSRVVHVARQGILDARGHVIGYELLYRSGPQDPSCTADGDFAGARLLADAVLDLRLDTITDGRTAFINLTRSLLLNGAATLLRPEVAVFELREDISIDGDVIEACRSLSASGFRLARPSSTVRAPP